MTKNVTWHKYLYQGSLFIYYQFIKYEAKFHDPCLATRLSQAKLQLPMLEFKAQCAARIRKQNSWARSEVITFTEKKNHDGKTWYVWTRRFRTSLTHLHISCYLEVDVVLRRWFDCTNCCRKSTVGKVTGCIHIEQFKNNVSSKSKGASLHELLWDKYYTLSCPQKCWD